MSDHDCSHCKHYTRCYDTVRSDYYRHTLTLLPCENSAEPVRRQFGPSKGMEAPILAFMRQCGQWVTASQIREATGVDKPGAYLVRMREKGLIDSRPGPRQRSTLYAAKERSTQAA